MTLVLALGYGVAGAAMGTALAEVIGVVLGIAVLRRLGSESARRHLAEILNRAAMLQNLAMNRDIMIRNIALIVAFSIFSVVGARSGDVTLAANAVLYNMFLIGGYFLDGFATAAETLCGQCIGARDERNFRRAVGLSLFWSFGFGAAVFALFLFAGGPFIDFVTTNADVRAYAREFLVFAAPYAASRRGGFRVRRDLYGCHMDGGDAQPHGDLAFALFAVVLFLMREAGNTGLWIALLVFLGTRGAVDRGSSIHALRRATFASDS